MASIESRALELLGTGLSAEVVASALGVTAGRISQLLADEEFSNKVVELRYKALSAHNQRDTLYDRLEDKALEKLEKSLPLMFRPAEILATLKILNGAKRRGQAAPASITNQQTVVQITLPTIAVNKFITNAANQVVQAGSQELVTMQSGTLLKEVKQANQTNNLLQLEAPTQNDTNTISAAPDSTESYKSVATRFKQKESELGAAINFIPVGN